MLSPSVAVVRNSSAQTATPTRPPRPRGVKTIHRVVSEQSRANETHAGRGKVPEHQSRFSGRAESYPHYQFNGLKREDANLLPVSFFNAQGKWESGSVPSLLAIHEDDDACSYSATSSEGGRALAGGVEPLPRAAACERLRRTLFETGQLLVTTQDGLSRVWFAGVGDPDELFVEVIPRDATPAQEAEHAFPGCVCSLREAEALLNRIYEGEGSARLTRLVEKLREEMKL